MLVLPDGDGYLVSFSTNVFVAFQRLMLCATVINGIISFPIAVLAFFCLPDTPGTAKPNWLFSERVSNSGRPK